MERAGRVTVQERAMLALMVEAAAARRRLQVLPDHRLWDREDPLESVSVLTQGGWETGAMPATT